jgi:hypothetical protein
MPFKTACKLALRTDRGKLQCATLKALATTGDLPDAQPVHVGLLRRCSMHWWPSELSLVLSVWQLDFTNSDEQEKRTNRESSMVGLLTDGRRGDWIERSAVHGEHSSLVAQPACGSHRSLHRSARPETRAKNRRKRTLRTATRLEQN